MAFLLPSNRPGLFLHRAPGSKLGLSGIWMIGLHQQIVDLEAEIDALSDAAEQCRKSMVLAKVAIGGGILLYVASLLGLIRPDAILLVVGIAAALAGIVFYG